MSNLTYTMRDGYRLPNLLPPQEPERVVLGKYALLHRKFLKENRRVTYTNLLTSGKLNSHLMEAERQATERMERLTVEMAKAQDQMKWVGLMNNIRASAEESVLAELIYA